MMPKRPKLPRLSSTLPLCPLRSAGACFRSCWNQRPFGARCARSAETSFLATPEATCEGIETYGFVVSTLRDTTTEAMDYGARSRAMVERGEKPPHRAVRLIHGDMADEASANTARGLAERRIVPIEITCFKPPKEHS